MDSIEKIQIWYVDLSIFIKKVSQTHGDHQGGELCEYGLVELKTLEVTFDIVTSRKNHPFEGKSLLTIGISVTYPLQNGQFGTGILFYDIYVREW